MDDLDAQIAKFTGKAGEPDAEPEDSGGDTADGESGAAASAESDADSATDEGHAADSDADSEGDEEPDDTGDDDGEEGDAEAEEEDEEGDEDDGVLSAEDTLKKARELVRRGDAKGLKQAVKMTFGVELDAMRINGKKWEAWRKKTRAADENLRGREQQVGHQRAQLAQIAQNVEAQFGPAVQAAQAYKQGDYDKFRELVEHISGDSYDAATRNVVREHISKDPEKLKFQKQLEEERRGRLKLEAELRQKEAEQKQNTAQAGYKAKLQKSLSSGKFAEAAKVPEFIEAVFQVQREHYDQQTDTTLPDIEAARLVIERERQRRQSDPLGPVLGIGPVAHREPDNPAESDQGGTSPAKRRNKKRRSLRRNEAAAASGPGRRLTEDELIEKYAKRMKQADTG